MSGEFEELLGDLLEDLDTSGISFEDLVKAAVQMKVELTVTALALTETQKDVALLQQAVYLLIQQVTGGSDEKSQISFG